MPAFSRPVYSPLLSQNNVEFFRNANNPVIHGSSFHVDNSTNLFARKDGFQILQEHVAAAAFHNSMQRVDPPRCHPHTREAVLDEIFEWIVGNVPRETWIAWLNGAAGAGKSAICQSLAERCIQYGIMVASFFFFRADGTRNTIDPLVATLAYQIIQLLPQTKKSIVEAIESNPLIFQQTLKEQLEFLIIRPLCLLQISNPLWKLLVIIDGVDECAGDKAQMNLIRTVAKLMRIRDLPFIVLFSSRRENQILMAFNPRNMNGTLKQIPLDDNYHAEEDILHFLDDSFDKIKQTHPFSDSLAADWPSSNHVQEIASKSSGQFIYASVVINFLSHPSGSPSALLDIILGLRPSGRLTPFAQLDALYSYLFSQVEDTPTTLDVLAYIILGDENGLMLIKHFFELEEADILSVLAPLASVVVCDMDQHRITFHHASLPDFLRDKARSKEYCINALATPLCIHWFKAVQSGRFIFLDHAWRSYQSINGLLEHAESTNELYESVTLRTPLQTPRLYYSGTFSAYFLTAIRNMNFPDRGKVYNNMLNTIVRYIKMECSDARLIEDIEREQHISQILAQLAIEDGEEPWSRSESDAESEDGQSDSAHASPEEAASNVQLPASITDIKQSLPSPFVAQFDGPHEARQVSNSADHYGITEKRKRGTTPINRPAKHTKK